MKRTLKMALAAVLVAVAAALAVVPASGASSLLASANRKPGYVWRSNVDTLASRSLKPGYVWRTGGDVVALGGSLSHGGSGGYVWKT